MQTKTFIQFTNVEILQNKTTILQNVSFSVFKGDFVYVLGNTGSGKSSLLDVLSAQLPITKGTVVLDDISIHNISAEDIPYLRRKLGIISSSYPLLEEYSVEENLDFVLSATGWDDISSRQTQLERVFKLLKIEDLKTKKIPLLSKKEYVQVLIARALLNAPSILLIDAPVEHLDVQAAQEVLGFLYHYAQHNGITTFFATVNNKIPQLLAGDKALLCKDGTVVDME